MHSLAKVILLTSKYYPQSGTPCVLFLLGFIRKRKSSFLYPDDQFNCVQANEAYKTLQQFVDEKKEIVTLSVFWLERFYFSGFSIVFTSIVLQRFQTRRKSSEGLHWGSFAKFLLEVFANACVHWNEDSISFLIYIYVTYKTGNNQTGQWQYSALIVLLDHWTSNPKFTDITNP